MSWIVYALLSALFASLTAILAKIGIKDVTQISPQPSEQLLFYYLPGA